MEVLAVAAEVLRRLGLDQGFVITLSDVEIFNGIVENLGLDGNARDELRRLVDIMPRDEHERLLPDLQRVQLSRNRILYEVGDEIRSAYFLSEGLVSLLAITEAGQTVALCTIGKEGIVGLPIVLGVPVMPCRFVTQLPSEAVMINSEPLLMEFKRGGTLQQLLLKYAYAQQSQVI
jgi:CRP-like cAMP-binding protein